MAVYKVPQDVEADDKLLGPFSFRQFIYLIIVAIGMAVLFFLFRLSIVAGFIGTIPIVPIIILFGAIALPLKKDQPMETYLLAIVRFNLKPRMRLWSTDGSMALVDITAPKVVEEQRFKNISGAEAESRLSYLANIMDTRGWASRGVPGGAATAAVPLSPLAGAADTEDILDESANVSRSFEQLLAKNDETRRKDVMDRMHNPQPPQSPYDASWQGQQAPPADDGVSLTYNPYPSAIHQHVLNPLGDKAAASGQKPMAPPESSQQAAKPAAPAAQGEQATDKQKAAKEPTKASLDQVPPDIIRLAENKDLNISAIANEAHRIQKKADSDEVVISLR
jgi:hypothetical protein